MLVMSLVLSQVACVSGADSAAEETGADTADTADSGGENPASLDPMVNSYIPEGYPGETPARVIFMGDSITAGYGASKNKLAYPALLQDNDDKTWAGFEDFDFPGLYGATPEVVDVSVPGATTGSMVGQQLPNVTDAVGDSVSGPTAVVVTIVGNDVQAVMLTPDKVDASIATITENMGEFYDYYADTTRFPDGVRIYLANVYEPSDGVGQADECFYGLNLEKALPALDAINAATLAQAQERGAAWLDMHGHFLGHGYNGDDPENAYYQADDPSLWFADDCIHPNDRGHHEIRRLFWYAMAGQSFPGDAPVAE